MNTITIEEQRIGDIVAGDIRTAAVFQRHGIDFCCGGRQSLGDACAARGIASASILEELDALRRTPDASVERDAERDLDALVAHILDTHHAYLRKTMPVLIEWSRKVASAHGANHPETVAIAGHVSDLCADLEQHMFKEERILFPAIVGAVRERRAGRRAQHTFGTIANPIRMMEMEHVQAGNGLEEIRRLSAGFALPADACATFTALYRELAAFEADLHRHIHLENNILFPRALEEEHAAAA
jgi:regulator of cell morphogenesis and NO signaling